MFPHERSLVTRLKDKPFALLGVSSDSDREQILKFQRDREVTWRSWWNGKLLKNQKKPIIGVWEVSVLPTVILIDHKGRIRWREDGVPETKDLDRIIDQLIQEAERDRTPAS